MDGKEDGMCEEKVTVYCGDEEITTAAALGYAIQSAGRGDSVIIIQFLKGKREEAMELLRRLEPEVRFFSFARSQKNFAELSQEEQQEEEMNIRNGFNFARKVLVTGECSLLILDGFLGLLDNQMVSAEDLESLMKAKSEDTKVMFTGKEIDYSMQGYAADVFKIYKH